MYAAYEQYEKEFGARLSKLRMQKGLSARDMSLSLGQNPGYINSIENGKTLPSMKNFFLICDFLGITPDSFLDYKSPSPEVVQHILDNLTRLDEDKINHIAAVIQDLSR